METQSISIVIEWENVLLSEMERCCAMLKELGRQLCEFHPSRELSPDQSDIPPWVKTPVEVLVAYCSEHVDGSLVNKVLAESLSSADDCFMVRLLPASLTDSGYYDLKNFGARHATGDIIVFLDSDVIPEPGWLKALLSGFADPAVEVVCGNTYIGADNTLARAFALFWFFPVRAQHVSFEPTQGLYANNLAVRRKTFERFPFPKIEGTSRGSCVGLAAILHEHDITIYRHTGAKACHPPPNGLRHFLLRAIAQGRDEFICAHIRRPRWAGREVWRHIRQFLKDVKGGFVSVFRNARTVHLSLIEVPAVIFIGVLFYQIRLCAALVTMVFPGYMKSHFRV